MTIRRVLHAAAPLNTDLILDRGLPPLPGSCMTLLANQPTGDTTGGTGGTTGGGQGQQGAGQQGGQQGGQGGQGGGGEFVAPKDQAELDKMLGERLNRERAKFADYEDLKKKAAEHDKTVEAQKTEAQKLADRATTAEKTAADNELRALKAEVGLEKGLTASQIKRLHGSTRDELVADADDLLKDLGRPAGATGQHQVPGFDQGRQGGTVTPKAGEAGHAEAQRRFGKTAAGQAGTT